MAASSIQRLEGAAFRSRLAVALVAAAFAVGVPAHAVGAECEGDECQPTAQPPDDPTPGTAVVAGPGNPPVRFPKAHKPKHRHPKKHKAEARNGR